jgi:hypothetical protein
MKENGKITIWKELESMCGTMVVDMRVSIKMIKSMVLVSIHGLTADAMKATGTKANNMVSVAM